MNWFAVFQLIRPANVLTAIADIIAGIAIAGLLLASTFSHLLAWDILLLIIATSGLYAGGIVFNDVFDYQQDKINRPERVIPSGRVSLSAAKKIGIFLLGIGILAAWMVTPQSGIIAIITAALALSYDKYAKHHAVLGPINMGLCRSANLILGMSINPSLALDYWWIAILPLIFIAAITLTAQKETKGKNKLAIGLAMLLDLIVVFGFFAMYFHFGLNLPQAAVFLILWYGVNFYAKLQAIVQNEPKKIMKAVKIGVLSLIVLDASYVAGFSTIAIALIVILLLPLSLYLSKKFPVT